MEKEVREQLIPDGRSVKREVDQNGKVTKVQRDAAGAKK